jgi:hypothetical protein
MLIVKWLWGADAKRERNVRRWERKIWKHCPHREPNAERNVRQESISALSALCV